MNDATPLVKTRSFAPIRNVAGCMHLVERLRTRGGQDTNIGVMHGYAGVGKSYASIYTQIKTGAIRIKIGESWSRKMLIESILQELGYSRPVGSISKLVRETIKLLADDPDRPLFVDEADKLVHANAIEIIREIADDTGVPVLLIGEELLPQFLARTERVHSRILDFYPAVFCDLEDARKLADLFLRHVQLTDGLLDKARVEGGGRVRRIVSSLEKMRDFSGNTGLKALNVDNYTGGFSTGKIPAPRSGVLRREP